MVRGRGEAPLTPLGLSSVSGGAAALGAGQDWAGWATWGCLADLPHGSGREEQGSGVVSPGPQTRRDAASVPTEGFCACV